MAGGEPEAADRVASVTAVRAAGGVVWRHSSSGSVEVCLVHRPRYGDWSLPKGKLKTAEHPLAAAVREVREETAVHATPQAPLPGASYSVNGLPKVVEYWAMRVVATEDFRPGSEVDGVRWVPVPAAIGMLTNAHNVPVLEEFAARPEVTGVVLLLRHANAGRRESWPGPDAARPLDRSGVAAATALADLLALFAPTALVSAPPRRCLQTLAPLATAVDLPIAVESVFGEDVADALDVAERLRSLAASAECTIVCSQGGVIPAAMAVLTGGDAEEYHTPKGSAWLLPFAADGTLVTAPTPVSA
ncbi:MAG TPA: NUDIX domain-containing protein [Micromonosporaceae bacterium]|nr:NUDIX domain-containing protein [Micromonosporaceae bacterium]